MAHIITDFIRNTKRELYDEKLEDVLEMLDLEWSKDDDTKTKSTEEMRPTRMVQHGLNDGYSGKRLPNRWLLMTLCFCRNEKCMQKSA